MDNGIQQTTAFGMIAWASLAAISIQINQCCHPLPMINYDPGNIDLFLFIFTE